MTIVGLGTRIALGCIAYASLAVGCDLPPYIPPYEAPEIRHDTGGGETDGDTSGGDTSGCNIQPTLSDLNAKYFQLSCVFGGCHEAASSEGGLDMETAGLRNRLVNIAAHDDKAGPRGKVRVIANDPDKSFFIQKLEGTQARDEGSTMPDGTDEPIDPSCRIKMIRQWISDGALDN